MDAIPMSYINNFLSNLVTMATVFEASGKTDMAAAAKYRIEVIKDLIEAYAISLNSKI